MAMSDRCLHKGLHIGCSENWLRNIKIEGRNDKISWYSGLRQKQTKRKSCEGYEINRRTKAYFQGFIWVTEKL